MVTIFGRAGAIVANKQRGVRLSLQQGFLVQVDRLCPRIGARIRLAFIVLVLTTPSPFLAGTIARAAQARTEVNARDGRGLTALERAVAQGDVTAVLALIQAGADVNLRDASGRTVLSWAALQGRVEIVRALARAGADLNIKDEQGWTPVTLAFQAGHFAVVQALVEAGADVNRDQLREDVNKKDASGETLLARTHDTPSLRALIQLGADPNATDNGRTVLAEAASVGDLDRVRALIEAGADVNVKEENARDKQGWTALILASDAGRTAVVQALIKAGADVNVEGPGGWTALMRAAYFGRLETVRVLIPAANVNYRNKNGITALMLARWGCHLEIVEALVQSGAAPGSGEWRRAPRFDDFPATRMYEGVPAPVDLRSNPTAPSYRTRLRQGSRKGPNFAGRYTVVSWGCGSNCETTMIVDADTGRVYDGIGDERGAEFKLTSDLLIADPALPPDLNAYTDNPTDSLPIRYYVWKGHEFKLIYEEACSVVNQHQKCGCESLKAPVVQPGLK